VACVTTASGVSSLGGRHDLRSRSADARATHPTPACAFRLRSQKDAIETSLTQVFPVGYMVINASNMAIAGCGSREYESDIEDVERCAFVELPAKLTGRAA
jgi:hypothetical protein